MPPFDFSKIERYALSLKDEFHRYHSWDTCFNEFSTNNDSSSLALHLGFFLASWGMYRGSGGLLQKNYKVHLGAVEILKRPAYVTLYNQGSLNEIKNNIPLTFELRTELSVHYGKIGFERKGELDTISDTDTLLSKIMLGATGCVPAFDRYFIAGLKEHGIKKIKFNADSLSQILSFIDENHSAFIKAIDHVEKVTLRRYPLMKIVDMYFWQTGFDATASMSAKNTTSVARV